MHIVIIKLMEFWNIWHGNTIYTMFRYLQYIELFCVEQRRIHSTDIAQTNSHTFWERETVKGMKLFREWMCHMLPVKIVLLKRKRPNTFRSCKPVWLVNIKFWCRRRRWSVQIRVYGRPPCYSSMLSLCCPTKRNRVTCCLNNSHRLLYEFNLICTCTWTDGTR